MSPNNSYLSTSDINKTYVLHICGMMNADIPTPHVPGQHYDIDLEVPLCSPLKTALQPVLDTSLFPALLNSPFGTSNICACTCHRYQITSRPNPPHGSPCVVNLSTTRNKTQEYICPVHTNSTVVHLTGPSGTDATVQTVASYDHATQTPQNHKGKEELPVPLLPLSPRNGFPDPWSSEVAHAFPWNERFAALKVMLNDLEPSLNLLR